jgi:hypothetical protein
MSIFYQDLVAGTKMIQKNWHSDKHLGEMAK